MYPDFRYELEFAWERRLDVLTVLQRRSDTFALRATVGAGHVSGGCCLALDMDEELEQVIRRQGYDSMILSTGRAQVGMIFFWGEPKPRDGAGPDEETPFELSLWPCTTGLQRVFLGSGVVRSFLIELLTSLGGLQGRMDFGDGSGACFWSAKQGAEGWFDLERRRFVPVRP